jgi:hypothetical protein
MGWLDIFKSKKKCECLFCGSKNTRKDVIEIKYRYGEGQGLIGSAFICNTCDTKYNAMHEGQEYVESI